MVCIAISTWRHPHITISNSSNLIIQFHQRVMSVVSVIFLDIGFKPVLPRILWIINVIRILLPRMWIIINVIQILVIITAITAAVISMVVCIETTWREDPGIGSCK